MGGHIHSYEPSLDREGNKLPDGLKVKSTGNISPYPRIYGQLVLYVRRTQPAIRVQRPAMLHRLHRQDLGLRDSCVLQQLAQWWSRRRRRQTWFNPWESNRDAKEWLRW